MSELGTTARDKIVEILREEEDNLSDGFAWYCVVKTNNPPHALTTQEVQDIVTNHLRTIAERILSAIHSHLLNAKEETTTEEVADEEISNDESLSYGIMFHFLWTNCVNKPGYVKEEWVSLEERLLESGIYHDTLPDVYLRRVKPTNPPVETTEEVLPSGRITAHEMPNDLPIVQHTGKTMKEYIEERKNPLPPKTIVEGIPYPRNPLQDLIEGIRNDVKEIRLRIQERDDATQ